MNLYIGLMSGTSMDGIDAALMDVDTNALIGGITRPYSDEVRQHLNLVLNEKVGFETFCQLNTLLGREFALAVHQLLESVNVSVQDVVAIGSHGQTICHDAMAKVPYTLQLGCAHTIAEFTGLPVVADFRTRDLVIGGQGAPFAPMYHQALFGQESTSRVLVNIGGISNVTTLVHGEAASGYDVGPGNCLMDLWAHKHIGTPYDANGAWAAKGQIIHPLLDLLLADDYFKLPAPKSIGKEYFSWAWLERFILPDYSAVDVQATLMALTASSIADAIQQQKTYPEQVMICGGGAHNITLCLELANQLPQLDVFSTKQVGVNPDFIEAMMFAWLAEKAIKQIPLDFGAITGAKKTAIYGAIYPAGLDKGNWLKV